MAWVGHVALGPEAQPYVVAATRTCLHLLPEKLMSQVRRMSHTRTVSLSTWVDRHSRTIARSPIHKRKPRSPALEHVVTALWDLKGGFIGVPLSSKRMSSKRDGFGGGLSLEGKAGRRDVGEERNGVRGKAGTKQLTATFILGRERLLVTSPVADYLAILLPRLAREAAPV